MLNIAFPFHILIDALHKLVITIPEIAKIGRVTVAMFIDENNMPVNMFGLTNIGGRRGQSIFYANNTKIPTKVLTICDESSEN